MMASALSVLAAACAPVAPESTPGPVAALSVRLVDSIPWENEMIDGFLRRVEVRTGARLDTIPRVTTYQLPQIIGDTILAGLAYKDDGVVAGYVYDPRTRRITRTPMPADLNPSLSAPSLAPDGRHLAYIEFTREGGRGVVRTWPARERVLLTRTVGVPGTDAPGGHWIRWLGRETLEIYIETDAADSTWYRIRASLDPARIIAADSVRTLQP